MGQEQKDKYFARAKKLGLLNDRRAKEISEEADSYDGNLDDYSLMKNKNNELRNLIIELHSRAVSKIRRVVA